MWNFKDGFLHFLHGFSDFLTCSHERIKKSNNKMSNQVKLIYFIQTYWNDLVHKCLGSICFTQNIGFSSNVNSLLLF